MCGIVGYVGTEPCEEILLAGLERLEYRGYDSAGLSLVRGGRIERVRSVGNLAALRAARARGLSPTGPRSARGLTPSGPWSGSGPALLERPATVGIGHTRWATHGAVTEENAHPHTDTAGRIHVVLNGIVENHVRLRRRLERHGAEFTSETDAEVVAHLLAARYDGHLAAAVREAHRDLEGHFAFVAVCADEPGLLVGTRRDCPLVAGLGEDEQLIASSLAAFIDRTRRARPLADGDVASLRAGEVRIEDRRGQSAPAVAEVADHRHEDEAPRRTGFDSFMLKEIHEQPRAVAETLAERCRLGRFSRVERVTIVACGSSYHAGLLGRCAIERWAGLPVSVEVASEYRYREGVADAADLVIGISQSGETADTLAAMRLAAERGARVLAVTNVPGSQATREAGAVMHTRAGTEVGVAATKTFVAQAVALEALALELARVRKALPPAELHALAAELGRLPAAIERVIESSKPLAQEVAARYAHEPFFLFLGRGPGLPLALEGALKLKEIAYVACDAYAAGEMKHGPIAMLSPGTPVIALATESPVLGKLLSNVSEVRARGAHVIAIASEGAKEVAEHAEEVVYVPRGDSLVQVLPAVVPLQLIAYEIAKLRGLNVDQPRNLAKTVTVE